MEKERRDEVMSRLAVAEALEALKSVTRTAWTAQGRRESTAEHSWRLACLALLFLGLYPGLDARRVLALCLLHDVGEAETGDVSAALRPDRAAKARAEQRTAESLFAPLPEACRAEMLGLWREYEEGATQEARLVKALDKAETILQHCQGSNPPGFDYAFNLEYGRALFEGDAVLALLREELDRRTRARAQAEGAVPGGAKP